MRVLVVEDEVKMAALLRRGLGEEGLTVDIAGEGERAVEMAGASKYDAVVLDVMLPDGDGYGFCEGLRREGLTVPVMMLTARSSRKTGCAASRRRAGLPGQALRSRELFARVRALSPHLERPPESSSSRAPHRRGPARGLQPEAESSYAHRVRPARHLVTHRGKVLSREELLASVWV